MIVKRILGAIIWSAVAILLVVIPAIMTADSTRVKYKNMERDYQLLEESNARLRQEVEELENYVRHFNNTERFQEKVIRQELGFVGQNELVYRIGWGHGDSRLNGGENGSGGGSGGGGGGGGGESRASGEGRHTQEPRGAH